MVEVVAVVVTIGAPGEPWHRWARFAKRRDAEEWAFAARTMLGREYPNARLTVAFLTDQAARKVKDANGAPLYPLGVVD